MYKRNIIAAGKMMGIVVMLFGVLYCAAAFVPASLDNLDECPLWLLRWLPGFILGAGVVFLLSGTALVVMFSCADRNPALGTPILLTGSLFAVCAIVLLVFLYLNPFSWMTAILGVAVFVDSLCFKLGEGGMWRDE